MGTTCRPPAKCGNAVGPAPAVRWPRGSQGPGDFPPRRPRRPSLQVHHARLGPLDSPEVAMSPSLPTPIPAHEVLARVPMRAAIEAVAGAYAALHAGGIAAPTSLGAT